MYKYYKILNDYEIWGPICLYILRDVLQILYILNKIKNFNNKI